MKAKPAKNKVPDAESKKKPVKLPERGGRTAKHEKMSKKGNPAY